MAPERGEEDDVGGGQALDSAVLAIRTEDK